MTVSYFSAAAAGILGAASLLLFGMFLWTGALGFVDFGMTQNSLLAWDAGLCLLFFLQHSAMVRTSFRTRLKRFVPAHCHGVVYTIASGIALLLLVGYWQSSPVVLYDLEGAGRLLARGLLLLALVGVVWGMGSLENFDAFGIEAFLAYVRRTPPRPARLTIKGPYKLVRHPFYSFGIVALWATPTLTLDRLVLNALFTAWILLGAALEERDLAEEFGEPYRLYQRAVPMFVPRPWGRR